MIVVIVIVLFLIIVIFFLLNFYNKLTLAIMYRVVGACDNLEPSFVGAYERQLVSLEGSPLLDHIPILLKNHIPTLCDSNNYAH